MWIIIIVGAVGSAIVLSIMLFGPSATFKSTRIHQWYIWLSSNGPAIAGRIIHSVLGPRCVHQIRRCGRWVGFQRNPLVQIFYVTLVASGCAMFFYAGWYRILSLGLSPWHRVLWVISILTTYLTFGLACNSDPGKIIQRSVAESWINIWPYDHILFDPIDCRTCKFTKPARSKHCSLCNVRILRQDHHCIWINQCVGHANQPHFIAFLLSTTWISGYTCYLSFTVAYLALRQQGWVYLPDNGSVTRIQFFRYGYQGHKIIRYSVDWTEGLMLSLMIETMLVALGLFLVFTTFIVSAFTCHHLWLNILRGTTTNESHKWSDIYEAIKSNEIWFTQDDQTGRYYLTTDPDRPKVTDWKKYIKHAYNKDIWNNVREVLWPSSISPVIISRDDESPPTVGKKFK